MMARRWRAVVPLVALATACAAMGWMARDDRPSARDDEVFLQAAYLMRTEHVSAIEAITRAAEIQYGWGGELSARLRSQGDIQTYALVPVWSVIGGFRVAPSPTGRALYVESPRLRWVSFAFFAVTVFAMYWAVLPLGRGVAAAVGLLLALGHPFRHGPTLFDPWVMPLAAASIGWWLRDRHHLAAIAVVAAVLVKPNYVFLLPAMALAVFVRPATGDPDGRRGVRVGAWYAGALTAIVVAYVVLAAVDVIALGEYERGVRSGYDPGVLAYSALETVSYTYWAGVVQLRHHWPLFPWTFVNLAVLVVLGARAVLARRLGRTAALLGGLIAIPLVANFMVLPSVAAYEDGGHFRWVNVSIMAMAIALPLGYRELARRPR